jgi:hypothetical protein
MVDQAARRKYAELVRQFISGRMTNVEYEARYGELRHSSQDKAFHEINSELLWSLSDDVLTHRLTGVYHLDSADRRTAARAVLFLQSGQEYQWPAELWDGSAFLATAFLVVLVFALLPETSFILRTGVAGALISIWVRYERWRAEQQEKAGDEEAWPFLRLADLADARRHPRLLNGNRTMS